MGILKNENANSSTGAASQPQMPGEPQPAYNERAAPNGGAVDIEAMRSEMTIDPPLQDMYDKLILNGRRIMFDQETFGETSKYMSGPEPLDQKIADGIVAVVVMLHDKTNKGMHPRLIVPVTLGLTLDAFEFIQRAGDPAATKQVLGEAVAMATTNVMEKFGVPQDQLAKLVEQNRAAVDGGQPPEQPGILGAA